MTVIQCQFCKNYLGNMTCKAFPDRIPNVILLYKHDHTKPYKGDNGIRFEPIKGIDNRPQSKPIRSLTEVVE